MENFQTYLDGTRLYGDDFGPEQIQAWFADEAEGYADLGAKDASMYAYAYHAWNWFHAFRHLQGRSFAHVLGFGSAYGDELGPVLGKAQAVTIVDPSDAFARATVGGVPVRYVKPYSDGRLPLPDNTFDLATCLGVLHHIPNVSFVVSELARVLRPGAILILREPIISMGDWRKPRRGLTKRERGIPLALLEAMLRESRLEIIRKSLCGYPLTPRLFRPIRKDVYNSRLATLTDWLLCAAFAWNINYHPRTLLEKFRPTSAFFVLQRV